MILMRAFFLEARLQSLVEYSHTSVILDMCLESNLVDSLPLPLDELLDKEDTLLGTELSNTSADNAKDSCSKHCRS